MAFFVTVRNADGLVYGRQTGPTIPANTAEKTFVELTEQEYSNLGQLTLPQNGGPAYQLSNGSIVARPDERYVAEFALSKTIADENEFVGVTITVKDYQGSVLTGFNGTRRIGIRRDATIRRVKVPFANGVATKNIQFPQSGDYTAFTLEPDLYRVSGDINWSIEEIW